MAHRLRSGHPAHRTEPATSSHDAQKPSRTCAGSNLFASHVVAGSERVPIVVGLPVRQAVRAHIGLLRELREVARLRRRVVGGARELKQPGLQPKAARKIVLTMRGLRSHKNKHKAGAYTPGIPGLAVQELVGDFVNRAEIVNLARAGTKSGNRGARKQSMQEARRKQRFAGYLVLPAATAGERLLVSQLCETTRNQTRSIASTRVKRARRACERAYPSSRGRTWGRRGR